MKQVLFCGWNGFGQLPNESECVNRPTLMPLNGSISCVSCSWSLVSAITDNNVVLMGFLKGNTGANKTLVLPENKLLKQVSSSTNHTLIFSDDGICWRHAADTDSLLQVVNFLSTESDENFIDDLADAKIEKVLKVCCSDYINLALCNSGRVFSIPTSISLPGKRAVDVACGNEHCILLTDNGEVYSWGSGSRGQLGHGDLESEESPRVMSALQDLAVTSLSCGAWHCAVITSCGDLYTWGWDCMGQLGRASSQYTTEDSKVTLKHYVTEQLDPKLSQESTCSEGPVQTIPIPIDTPCDVKAVSCGARHTVVLLEDGSVWGCGWNAYGQLGIPPEACSQSAHFRKLFFSTNDKKVSEIVCGGWSTCLILECD